MLAVNRSTPATIAQNQKTQRSESASFQRGIKKQAPNVTKIAPIFKKIAHATALAGFTLLSGYGFNKGGHTVKSLPAVLTGIVQSLKRKFQGVEPHTVKAALLLAKEQNRINQENAAHYSIPAGTRWVIKNPPYIRHLKRLIPYTSKNLPLQSAESIKQFGKLIPQKGWRQKLVELPGVQSILGRAIRHTVWRIGLSLLIEKGMNDGVYITKQMRQHGRFKALYCIFRNAISRPPTPKKRSQN
ncbi:MAG: hypothetical protein AAGI66_06085 [Cyanobacteria bacterium P01_H01_bin.74]